MKKIYLPEIILFFLISTSLFAQSTNFGEIRGKVLDSQGKSPLGFATVSVFDATSAEKKLVNGGITSEDGTFSLNLPQGAFAVLVEFMGYRAFELSELRINRDNRNVDLGSIEMEADTENLDEVVVQGEKTMMELSLDKRIFNVGKDLANAGGTASDILMNLPSITVDPEGGVSLRGSSNVRILVDGKPSGLVSFKGSSGLQQLPASMIETVEVITNPSARYEAEGMAGVINIVLKKENNQGFNASLEGITGNPHNFGMAANLNYRRKNINWFVNYGVAYRRVPREGTIRQEVSNADTSFYSYQTTRGTVNGLNNNIRAGLDYFFSEKSVLTGSYLWRRSDARRLTNIRYDDYTREGGSLDSYTLRTQDEDEKEPNSEFNLTYKRSFDENGHVLSAAVTYLDYWENSDQVYTQDAFFPDGTAIPGGSLLQTSINDEFDRQWLLQLDYTQPIGSEGSFETGIRSSIRNMENDFIVNERTESGAMEPLPGLDDIFLYDENIHAAYAILGNKSNKLSYQGGLRLEYTDVKTTLVRSNEVNPRDYVNLFPSAHFTYNISPDDAMQLSYSRRIRRPVYNDLSPFMTFSDARNFFAGNPDLNPEYTDAFEFGHIKYMNHGSLFSTVYYRNTKDKIERIRRVDEDGNSTTFPENLIGEQSMGFEFTTDYYPVDWWKLDANFNFFYARVDGSNILDTYTADTYSWFTRLTSRFTLNNGLDLQLRGNYEGRRRVAQGVQKAITYLDISASKDILNGRGTLILNVMDVFNSRRNRYIFEGPGFLTVGDILPRKRQINLTLNYRIKQSKAQSKPTILGEE
ncbi:Outer membrane receptor proteins, mostly Fe transport [Cyclobacterium xiamenense]|uniref:Outer membrane receptor proteins, mostly Fe transport n=1 Tax=Cyclobacterium xiamenense TaxID=1297121 RepID=A0A1H6WP80_9BACT|nr:TonB-dependent receptor [Cyclobacterium xiamenense]SEJ14175.1 Outer membrane receptor proteins, mostly Fe transport [Cyclobacterium xiamenense]